MTPNKFYYISSGAKNAMRTLRAVINVPGAYFRDEYVCNLTRDWNEAYEKARVRVGTDARIEGSDFDLNDWGKKGSAIKPWMKSQLEQIEMGYIPFGKHVGEEIQNLPEGYIKYWVEQSATNVVGQRLVQVITDLANERDYFTKWENEDAVREQKRQEKLAKMNYVGNVGDRSKFFLRCDKVLSFGGGTSGNWGPSWTTYLNICADRDGNEFVYKGSKAWEEGKYYVVTATIKEHKMFNDKKQNIINRPKIEKTIEKEAENA